jgi:hypothetical protein
VRVADVVHVADVGPMQSPLGPLSAAAGDQPGDGDEQGGPEDARQPL